MKIYSFINKNIFMRSSSLTTAIPYLKQFDPYDTYHTEYVIELHRKRQDEFEEIATTYFPGTAYGDIMFSPFPWSRY